jgi:glycosyltransferase involved in cell wall biosynthesis
MKGGCARFCNPIRQRRLRLWPPVAGYGGRAVETLRIGVAVPPMLAVPPVSYAGTERVVAVLVAELHRRGHKVTLFAAGDSTVECELVPTIPQSLWSIDYRGDISNYMALTIAKVWQQQDRFDVIHSHLETTAFPFARHSSTPVVSTLHGRLDVSGIPALMTEFTDIPLVAISKNQRRWAPHANWVATIHHGLELEQVPFSAQPGEYLAFVGRVAPEKGVRQAIELARRVGLQLRMVAKVYDDAERAHYDKVVAPAVEDGTVDFLGELPPAQRDPVLAGARATLMIGQWPEPFGLVAIESMAAGTPVIARRAGALTETIEDGVDGFLIDDLTEAALAVELVGDLDRATIRRRALERFSPARMVDQYEQVYRRLIEGQRRSGRSEAARPSERAPVGAFGADALGPNSNGSGANQKPPIGSVSGTLARRPEET